MRSDYVIKNENGEILTRKGTVGLIFNWLISNEYFKNNPGAIVQLTEDNTRDDIFCIKIDENTKQADIAAECDFIERGL